MIKNANENSESQGLDFNLTGTQVNTANQQMV